jgi:uncharacterized membrane protein
MANNYDIKIYQGATFSLGLTIEDDTGALVDLTGHTFRGQVRRTVSSAAVEAQFTFTIQDQIANRGQVTCVIPSSTTAALVVDASSKAERKSTIMTYDIESESGGVVVRWLQGLAEINPEATK